MITAQRKDGGNLESEDIQTKSDTMRSVTQSCLLWI